MLGSVAELTAYEVMHCVSSSASLVSLVIYRTVYESRSVGTSVHVVQYAAQSPEIRAYTGFRSL